ncbi:hypothetical protein BH11MYX4_BH11MYX4_18250 [soil metagenome]
MVIDRENFLWMERDERQERPAVLDVPNERLSRQPDGAI